MNSKNALFLFSAAALGGVLVAVIFLIAGVGTDTKTVVESTPITRSEQAGGNGLTARQIYKRDAPGVVFIQANVVRQSQSPFTLPEEQRGQSTGSGFVIDDEGHILTNAHVIAGATKVTVKFAEKDAVEAEVVGRDVSTDLALLKVDPSKAEVTPLKLGDSKNIEVGDPTVAIGNPFGLERTLTTGVISALQRKIEAPNGFQIDNVIQTDAAINPGNSGGPLINAAGEVIGVNSQIVSGGGFGGGGNVGIGFAVPIETAKRIIPQLEKDGKVERAFLGISGVTIDGRLERLNLPVKSGALVQEVTPDGPAAKAGVQGPDSDVEARIGGDSIQLGGDIITKIDGKPMKGIDEVVQTVESKKPGDEVKLTVIRGNQTKEITVELGKRSENAQSDSLQPQ